MKLEPVENKQTTEFWASHLFSNYCVQGADVTAELLRVWQKALIHVYAYY